MSKQEEDYPPTQEVTCPLCKGVFTATRQGTGKPWRGALDYWYGYKHDCPKQEEYERTSPTAALNKWMQS